MTAGTGIVHQEVETEPDHQSDDYADIKRSDQAFIVERVAENGLRGTAADVAGVVVAVDQLRNDLSKKAEEMGVEINVMAEKVFSAMHRV